MRRLFAAIISVYQRFSRLTPGVCRFYPTCSCYAKTAILRFGVGKGGLLAVKRLLHCHPWNPGGIDPVPEQLRMQDIFFSKLSQRHSSSCHRKG